MRRQRADATGFAPKDSFEWWSGDRQRDDAVAPVPVLRPPAPSAFPAFEPALSVEDLRVRRDADRLQHRPTQRLDVAAAALDQHRVVMARSGLSKEGALSILEALLFER
jgi:hypothetical protein